MLLDEPQVKVHLEEIAVFFPLRFALNLGDCILWVRKVCVYGLFEPVDVLDAVVRQLLIMDMVQPEIIFLVFDSVCTGTGSGKNEEKGAENARSNDF